MILEKITLHNFRNFSDLKFTFSPFLTIIYGENAQGKTNLLEAAYCLTQGSGFRESKEEELINIGKNNAEIEGLFINERNKVTLKIVFQKTKNIFGKKYVINNTVKKLSHFQQEGIKSVLFSPQQLEIISGSPDQRREYLDKQISFYDQNYKKKLNNYQNALRKRNKVLETYRTEKALTDELFFWDDYLEEQGDYLSEKRISYIEFLNKNPNLDSKSFFIKYQPNLFTKKRLKGVFEVEKRYRRTIIGPQKDDFQIYLDKKNIHRFGSRSEHRLGIFWLKINEIKYYESIFDKKPILLLDDVFSELDLKNKKLILDLITKYQTILTTAESEIVELSVIDKKVIRV